MHIFCALYDLSVQILTASPNSEMWRLTYHHCATTEEAENILRSAILQRTMPGEEVQTEWGILRVFMRNLVNRAQAPMPADNMKSLLDKIEKEKQDLKSRVSLLIGSLNNNENLKNSLCAFLDPERAPGQKRNYIEWLRDRIDHYSSISVGSLDTTEILSDLNEVWKVRYTKIPNMGLPLAANLFADIGIRASAKPDLHVLPTISGFVGRNLRTDECIEEIIKISQWEATSLHRLGRFSWLDGGLYPRDIDRIIYLIGSDNFLLNGCRKKRAAPERRNLMLKTLSDTVKT